MSRRDGLVSKRHFLRLYSATLIMTACSQDATAPSAPTSVASIELTPAAATVVLGHSLQLMAKARDSAGNELSDRLITWTSNAATQATVSAAGLVQALALSDTVLIAATSEGKSARARLVVVIDLAGEWNFIEHLTGVVSCDDTGSYRFAQTGGDIVGSSSQIGTCIGGGYRSSSDNTALGDPVSGGRLSSTHITFGVSSSCTYEGTVTAQPTPKLTGTLACRPTYTGSWEATPGGAPVAAVAVRWDIRTVVGGVTQLTAVVQDSAGHVLSRPVQWSSDDPTTFPVSPTGIVSARAVGSARITATSDGASGTASVTADAVTFTAVSTGVNHTCALTPAGAAYCWGWGGDGQLGTGFRRPAPAPLAAAETPLAVAGGHAFVAIAAGYQHSCGVTQGAEAYCWGDNSSGQLGDGSNINRLLPVLVTGGLQFASITVGEFHSCGRTTANAAYCWGNNGWGQLGDGSGRSNTSPVRVDGALLLRTVRAGLQHTCGVTTGDAAFCWGDNQYSQLGDSTDTNRLAPVPVAGGHTFATVASGFFHSCAVSLDRTAHCWGYNGTGGLGDGSDVDSPVPVTVAGGLLFKTGDSNLASGGEHSCALSPAGDAYCWGLNHRGQLGNGSIGGFETAPLQVLGGLAFSAISDGWLHSCGVTSAAAVFCWGMNADGQLGTATTEFCPSGGTYSCSTRPVLVIGQPGAGTLSAARLAGDIRRTRAAVPPLAPTRSSRERPLGPPSLRPLPP